MVLSDLPKPIQTFLTATEKRDAEASLGAFMDDAVLTDMGKEHRGAAIRSWNEEFYLGSNVLAGGCSWIRRMPSAAHAVSAARPMPAVPPRAAARA